MSEARAVGDAVRARAACDAFLLNFKKSGAPFWNFLHIEPIAGPDGACAFIVGVQCDVTQCVEAVLREGGSLSELKAAMPAHRVRHPALPTAYYLAS